VVDQYSGYTIIDDIKINGKLTNGEGFWQIWAGLCWPIWHGRKTRRIENLQPLDGMTSRAALSSSPMGRSWCTNERDGEISGCGGDRGSATRRKSTGQMGVAANMTEFSCRVPLQAGAADGAGTTLAGCVVGVERTLLSAAFDLDSKK